MTLWEAVRRTRVLLDDFGGDVPDAAWDVNVEDCGAKNRDITAALNEARTIYCDKHPVRDSHSELTRIALEADAGGQVALDPRILAVRQVRLSATGQALERTTLQRLDRAWPNWVAAVDDPIYWVMHQDDAVLQLVPAPDVATELQLTLDRLPLAPLNWDEDATAEIADIPTEHQDMLTYFAAAKLLRVPGAGADDLQLAKLHADHFQMFLGPQLSPQQRSVRRRMAGGPVLVRGLGQ